jgi:hypothetical protein
MTQEEIFQEMQKMLAKIPSIVDKIKEIKKLSYDRWELEKYHIENDCLEIHLVNDYRGDRDYDETYLPASALWDDNWVQKYEQQYKEEVEAERKRSEKQKKALEAETTQREKAQYELLKKKFEGQ